MEAFKPTSVHFFYILILIVLGSLPAQVESKFWMELAVNEKIRDRLAHWESKNLLFECADDLRHPVPEGAKPPKRCTLIRDRSKKDEIYTSKNFFVVYKPKLPDDLELEWYPTPIKGLPDSLFLAVSYEPLDYPDFVERGNDEIFGKKTGEPELDEIQNYQKISNINYLRENFDEIKPGFQLYQKELKELMYEYWLLFFVDVEVDPPQKPQQKDIKKKLMPQRSQRVPELVYDEIMKPVVGVLTKMMDPCFIATLVNSNSDSDSKSNGSKKNKKQVRISSKEANEYCWTACRFLAVAPLVLRKEVAEQCHNLETGKCEGNTCMCAKSQSAPGFSVTMAECNNRVVSVSGTGYINRFPDPFEEEQERLKYLANLNLMEDRPRKMNRVMWQLMHATRTCGGLRKQKPYWQRSGWRKAEAAMTGTKATPKSPSIRRSNNA